MDPRDPKNKLYRFLAHMRYYQYTLILSKMIEDYLKGFEFRFAKYAIVASTTLLPRGAYLHSCNEKKTICELSGCPQINALYIHM